MVCIVGRKKCFLVPSGFEEKLGCIIWVRLSMIFSAWNCNVTSKCVNEMLHMLKMDYLIYKCFVFKFLYNTNLNQFKL